MRLLVCGSRHFADPALMRRALSVLSPGDVLIHGGAPGADTIAGQLARERGIAVEVFNADWQRYGKAAGPLRNERMITEGKPDLVIAFPLGASPGTHDMIRRATAHGVSVLHGSYWQGR